MVRPRWSDMDSFGHVNHAKVVTLLEESRVPLLFQEAAKVGLTELTSGLVVVRLAVDYRAPIVLGYEDIRVEISLVELKNSSFTLGYRVYCGPSMDDKVAVTATTVLAPYDVVAQRPRRLTEGERAFLSQLPKEAGGISEKL